MKSQKRETICILVCGGGGRGWVRSKHFERAKFFNKRLELPLNMFNIHGHL